MDHNFVNRELVGGPRDGEFLSLGDWQCAIEIWTTAPVEGDFLRIIHHYRLKADGKFHHTHAENLRAAKT